MQNNQTIEILTKTIIEKDEIYSLIQNAQNGNIESRNKIIDHNHKLVCSIVKKYSTNQDLFEDLFQEGIQGLIKAIEKFNVSLGLAFSTYASFWIRQYISNYYNKNSSLVRIPTYLLEIVSKFKAEERKRQLSGENYDFDSIVKVIGIKKKQIDNLKNAISALACNAQGNDEENEHQKIDEIITSENNKPKNDNNELVDLALLVLTKKEAIAFLKRQGIIGNEKITLREIGKELNVTKERVRQIESKAINKLKFIISVALGETKISS